MSGPLFSDPQWPRAHRWLAGECEARVLLRLSVAGAPSCLGSLTKGRCDLAPAAIRRALERFSTYNLVNQVEVRQVRAHDWGDLPIAGQLPKESFPAIRDAVSRGLQESGT